MILELFNSMAKRFKRSDPQGADGDHPQALGQNPGNSNRYTMAYGDTTTRQSETSFTVNQPNQCVIQNQTPAIGDHDPPSSSSTSLYHIENNTGTDREGAGKPNTQQSGFFPSAYGFAIRDSVMSNTENNINYITNFIDNGKPVFDRLFPYTIPEAAMDSRARYPLPRCHPGTRRRIGTKLEAWLADERRQSKMQWLHGPAGVGKSAVAQTLAEYCHEQGRLGAAFFFSRPNNHNDPHRVIPTLAYQLAIQCHEYKSLLAHQLVNNPSILSATMHVQFRKLILDPFSELHRQSSPRVRQPYLIILDGLDECEGEDAQCEIVDMIGEVIRLKKDLPLLWLVCSRPEPHLRYTFSRADFSLVCGRETLVIDDEVLREVDHYLRDGFKEIRARFPYSTSECWPSEEQLIEVSRAASGLFIVASTTLRYIGDPKRANPPARLDAFLSFIKYSRDASTKNPLETLDILYTRILSDIPDDIFPITRRILSHLIYVPTFPRDYDLAAARTLCNFLRLDQSTFYSALQRLHSVIDVPIPEKAGDTSLRFYHASFGDYLRDPVRSGKFALEGRKAHAEIAKSCLYWHEIDSVLYHTDCEVQTLAWRVHNHVPLPGLKWGLDYNLLTTISEQIARFSDYNCWEACYRTSGEDQELLSQIHRFDFRYIEDLSSDFLKFVNWLYQQVSGDPGDSIVRTEPVNATDEKLLSSLELRRKPEPEPAIFPLDFEKSGYFFLGQGVKACIIYIPPGGGRR